MTLKFLLGSAALLSGVLAGFYFAYATVITAQRAVPDGAEAMRRMNDAVERPPFLALFMLGALLPVVAAIALVIADGFDARTVAGALGALCAIAAFVLTVAVNVPLNQRLMTGTVEWAEFARNWGVWNLARLWLSVAAAVGLAIPALR
ncbi:anthrone oxygenase family protein [Tsukamurella ocularis]|uniref:anthrone oxygenase family protein n=1 Tax=Tsukamurella ocularis TaxID=1970234 RepID=UPI002168612C|nr:anthrone oxygenase family protein [Tsukamurella ocularis]MCS3780783.1 putative membrane protein [Tsukamurella ocularis]MCS3786607.1 putative membrane protein [Tsukamurella ocularis]MCS3850449.1 putative membrane protein [Tsukamurella ocularis]